MNKPLYNSGNITDILRQIVGDENDEFYAIIAKVKSVNLAGNYCLATSLDTQADIKCRLKAGTGNSLLIIPTIGSFIIATPVTPAVCAIVMYSQVDSIQFLDGTYGGLVQVSQLITKINNLENKVNSLISYINGHVHAGNGIAPSPSFAGGALVPTVRADIENTKITHGSI